MARETKSEMVKASGRTYFFDLKETEEGKKYLLLTESRRTKNGNEFLRSTIILFPEQAQEFHQAVGKMTAKLA
jgi:hypothetical protein